MPDSAGRGHLLWEPAARPLDRPARAGAEAISLLDQQTRRPRKEGRDAFGVPPQPADCAPSGNEGGHPGRDPKVRAALERV